jgi:GH18 family chitinase
MRAFGAPRTGWMTSFWSPQAGPGTGIYYPYSVLPLSGAQVFENTTDVTSYSYNLRTRQLVSYDTPHIAALKAEYIQANGLAGSMFWEVCVLILRRKTAKYLVVSCPRIR